MVSIVSSDFLLANTMPENYDMVFQFKIVSRWGGGSARKVEKVDKTGNQDKIMTVPQDAPKWRNWQTRYVQGVVGVRS
jgi:hypothetical protein